MGNKKQFTELEIKDMVKMYTEDFESTKNIGLKYGVDREVIINRLKMNDVKIPKSSPYSEKYWLDRGLSEDKILEHIKTLRPVNKEHWIKKGVLRVRSYSTNRRSEIGLSKRVYR